MRRLIGMALILAAVGMVSAQSLKPENPYAMSAGINKGTSDSLVGTQYWYFYALPGSNRVTVRLKTPATLYGAQMNNNIVTIALYDEKRTFKITKAVAGIKNSSEATFTADNVKAKMKIIVSVIPPNQNLVRMGGEYELEATGNVQFSTGSGKADPIVQTYDSKMNSYGATRFLADGSIVASDGTTGTWKAFDPENRIYAIQIESFKFSLQYLPGYGLVRTNDPSLIVFQALRR
ncbi:MAG: hypothetical protein PSX80_12185 [bacterium]|nr:hypothetical protein [bacterium]